MKPDGGLPRIFESVEGFAERPFCPMSGFVAEYAEVVEEIGYLRRHNPFEIAGGEANRLADSRPFHKGPSSLQ